MNPRRTLTKLLAGWFVTVLVVLAGCSKKGEEKPAPTPAEKGPEGRVKRGTNGEPIITLDSDTQKLMGLEVAPLAAAQLKAEVKAYGQVLDPAPLAALVAEFMTAQAAAQASQPELKRMQTLAAQNNASERALQAAEATATRDAAQVESARLRLMASWGTAIAKVPDLPGFVKSLGTLESALVQVNLAAGESLPEPPSRARLAGLTDETKTVEATLLGKAPAVNPQFQSQAFLFLVSTNSAGLTPGAAVTAFLPLPGEAQTGAALPQKAVVHYNGATWVYRQTTETNFERVEVNLERPLDEAWFVKALKPGEKVVTAGAAQLLSEEIKGE